MAQTYDWLGGNFDNWSDANWIRPPGLNAVIGGNYNFGVDGRLALDTNGSTNANLASSTSGDRGFGSLNFARQAWTMTGSYFDVDADLIQVSASSPEVTITNDLIFQTQGISSSFSYLDFNVATQLKMTGLIRDRSGSSSTTGIVNKVGAGTVILTNRNTYSGGTNVNGGRLIDHFPHGNYNDNGALEFRTSTNQGYGGRIFGAGSFTKSGAGSVFLAGDVAYTGATIVDEGRLILNGLQFSRSFEIGFGGEIEFTFAGAQTLNRPVTGEGALIKTGTGTLTLSGPNTHTGGTIVSAGKVLDLNPHGKYATNGILELRNAEEVILSGRGGIAGSGSLIKSGAGNLIVGDNTYTGGTTVDAGRLTDFDPHGDYVTNAQLDFRPITNQTYAGSVSGTGILIKTNAATLTLSGVHSHTGGTFVEEGRLIVRNPRGNYNTNADLEFDLPSGLYGNDSTQISGSGAFTKSGDGIYFVTKPIIYGGATTVSGGSLIGGGNNVLPPSTALTVGASGQYVMGFGTSQIVGSLSGAGSVLLDRVGGTLTVSGGGDSTFSGIISGAGSLLKGGAGTLTLSGVNSYTGGTTVSSGRLVVQNPNGDYVNGAALEFDIASDRDFSTPVPVGPATPNAISGGGSFTKSGAGTLTLIKENTYTGGTTIKAGTLRLVQNNALLSGSDVDVASGATLDLNGNLQTLGDLTGKGNVALRDSGRLSMEGDGSTFGGVISGAGTFTKTGPGTLTLSGVGNDPGSTRVLDTGTLRVTGGLGGNLNVASGATFDNAAAGGLTLGVANLQGTVRTTNLTRFTGRVSGAGNFSGPGTVAFDGGYSPGNSPARITFGGNLALGSSNLLTMELGGTMLGTGYDHLGAAGTTSFGGSLNVTTFGGFSAGSGQSFELFDFASSTGSFSSISLPSLGQNLAWNTSSLYTTGKISVQAVPEPASLAVLGLGGLAVLRRRKARTGA